MTEAEAVEFACQWVSAWNARDLDRVMSHYDDDVVFTSPLVTLLGAAPDGTVFGIDALRAYFAAAISKAPGLRFQLDSALVGVDSVTVLYRNHRGQLSAEMMERRDGKVVRGIVHYAGSRR